MESTVNTMDPTNDKHFQHFFPSPKTLRKHQLSSFLYDLRQSCHILNSFPVKRKTHSAMENLENLPEHSENFDACVKNIRVIGQNKQTSTNSDLGRHDIS